MVLSALREENLAKIEEENEKKIVVLPCQVEERRKVEKLFEKDVWNSQRTIFKKKMKYVVRLIEKQVRSIEPGRGSQNFFKKISIDRKLDWINRNSWKIAF